MAMSDAKLRALMRSHIRNSENWISSEIASEREDSMDMYLGEVPGINPQEGRSAVVSSDIQDVIESIMPDMVEIFSGSDEAVRFEPVTRGDEEAADQATKLANHIWFKENNGYVVTHDWIKDALLQKNGFIKMWPEDTQESTKRTLYKVHVEDVDELMQDNDVEILAASIAEGTEDFPAQGLDPSMYWDLEIEHTDHRRKIKIEGLAPEDFIISRRAVDMDTAPLLCHQDRTTATELKDRGFDPDEVDKLPGYDEHQFNRERLSRWKGEDEWYGRISLEDKAIREIWVYECYVLMDYEETGLARRFKVVVAGDGYHILADPETGDMAVEVPDHPFVSLTPIRMPHKFFGRAIADLCKDIQQIKTVLWRQWMDNLYNINNNRTVINDTVDLDDMLTNRVSSVIRMDGDGDPRASVMPLTTESIGPHIAPALEFMDKIKDDRTGVLQAGPAADPEGLHKTFGGMNLVLGRAQKRILFIARTFAETGFKDAFKKLNRLLIENADQAYTIRLNGEWTDIDPRPWNAKMDATAVVGLGYGTKETQVALIEQLLQKQLTVIQMQGGPEGDLLSLTEVYEALKQWTQMALGEKDNERYWKDPRPKDGQPKQQKLEQPDPAMMEAQGKMQLEQQKMQAAQQMDQAKMQGDMQLSQAEMAMKQQAQAADIALKRESMLHEMELAREKVNGELMLAKSKADGELGVKREVAAGDLEIKASEAEQRLALQAQAQADSQNQQRENSERESHERAEKSNGKDVTAPVINVTIDNVPKGE
jgi:hypothetical protein